MPDHLHSTSRKLRIESLEQRAMLDASALRITEFMASNDNTIVDFEGDSSDWLEIFNPSGATVDLAGLYLTDDDTELSKWMFPSGTSIAPGEFLVVYASDKDQLAPNGELHTNFKLSADGEYLGLIDDDGLTIIDQFVPEFPPQFEDVSYGLTMTSVSETLVEDGDSARAWVPTGGQFDANWRDVGFNDNVFDIVGPSGFGYENSPGDNVNYLGQYSTGVPSGTRSLYVRVPFEVDSLDSISQLTLRMKFDDGFVAYLNGVEIASANAPVAPDWFSSATSTHDDFDAISFEAYDVSAAISSLVQGNNVLAIHALNFSAGSSDFLVVPELVAGEAGISSPESAGYFEEATPGSVNGESFAGFAAEPTFSVPHGFYETTQNVALATETDGAVIVYTTDGSTPAVDGNLVPINGQVYVGPIEVSSTTTIRATAFKQDFKPSFVQAASYLFLNDILTQTPSSNLPAGWPTGNVNGQLLNFGFDPSLLQGYGEVPLKAALTSIPSVMLTTDVENLFDSQSGIYVNALNRGREWERETSVEYIHPDATEGFSTNAGLRIRGGYHRNDFNPKHAFRLYFRNEYGDGLLDYPLFGDEGADRFDVLDLRTEQNYSWPAWGDTINGYQNSHLREVFARDTQADLDQAYTRSRYVHLYLNGQYWGLFMTQERIQEHYGENYLGGSEDDYDVVKSDPFESGGTEIADGTDVAWRQLFELAQAYADDPNGAADNYWTMQGLNSDGTRNESFPVLLDVENLIDYMTILFYTGGYDTGISAFFGNQRANNWFGIRNREAADEGFKFFLHDNEHSLGAGELTGSLHGTLTIDRTGPFEGPLDDEFEYFNPVFLHQDLLGHPEYTQRFVDNIQALMFNDGPLTAEASIARMQERKDQVDSAMVAESARWGYVKKSPPYSKRDWLAEANWLLNTYFHARVPIVINQLRNAGLFTSFDAPSFNQHGGVISPGFELSMSAGAGTIYFTTDGVTDPRSIGGSVNNDPAVQTYSGAQTLTEDVTVRARLRTPTGEWSGLVEANFSVLPFLQGDYDRNDAVNGADFLLWQQSFGTTVPNSYDGADGNGDLQVDQADLQIWTSQYATIAGAAGVLAVNTGLPDPTPLSDDTQSDLVAAALAWDSSQESSEVEPLATTEMPTEEVTINDLALAVLSSRFEFEDDSEVPSPLGPESSATGSLPLLLEDSFFD